MPAFPVRARDHSKTNFIRTRSISYARSKRSWVSRKATYQAKNFIATKINSKDRFDGDSGIKEKILAAKRAGIKEIILCHENKSDIDEIKAEYLEGLTFHYVKEMSEVLALALTDQNVKNAKVLK